MNDIRKLRKQLKYYFENNVKVKLITRNLNLKGQIISLPKVFNSSFELKLEDGNLMLVYLEDIYPDSVYPLSDSVEISEEGNKTIRTGIPNSLKMDLFRNHFGSNFKGKCFCCKKEIFRDKFEAGHYISAANGGSDSLDNLRPLCFDCNRSMSSMDMNDFINNYYS